MFSNLPVVNGPLIVFAASSVPGWSGDFGKVRYNTIICAQKLNDLSNFMVQMVTFGYTWHNTLDSLETKTTYCDSHVE